jgi:hypothetical protein
VYSMAEFDLTAELTSMMVQYSQEVAEEVKQICRDVSNEMTDNIKRDSPKRPKLGSKYSRGWKVRVEYEDNNNIRLRTYNATHYQLTHLLEHGHAKRNGGRVEGKPHIAPNEEKAEKELVKRIERAIQK